MEEGSLYVLRLVIDNSSHSRSETQAQATSYLKYLSTVGILVFNQTYHPGCIVYFASPYREGESHAL